MFVDNERFLLELENRRYCEENIGQYKEEDISCKVFTYYFYYVFCYPRFMEALLSNLHSEFLFYQLVFDDFYEQTFEFVEQIRVYDCGLLKLNISEEF